MQSNAVIIAFELCSGAVKGHHQQDAHICYWHEVNTLSWHEMRMHVCCSHFCSDIDMLDHLCKYASNDLGKLVWA